MKSFVLFFLLAPVSSALHAQYSTSHYQPKELYAQLGVKKVLIFDSIGDSLVPYMEYEYDAVGNEIGSRRYKYGEFYRYTFNSNGQMTASYFEPEGYGLMDRDTFIYKDSLLVAQYTYNSKGEITTRRTYTYTNGQLARSSRSYKSGSPYISTYNYNERGELIKVIRTQNGKLLDTTHRKYDQAGNLIEYYVTDENGQKELQQYHVYNNRNLKIELKIQNVQTKMLSQYYKTEYDQKDLISSAERWTSIPDGDLSKANYLKKIYKYEYF